MSGQIKIQGNSHGKMQELRQVNAELLLACKGLLFCIGSFAHIGTYPTPDEPEIVAARAAIAKAEGSQS